MSSVMLRSLSLGEALDTSLTLYRRLFSQLLGVSLATQAVPLALLTFINTKGYLFILWYLTLAYVVLSIVLSALGTAASTFIVSEYYLGRSISTVSALTTARRFMSRIVAVTLATALTVGVGFVFLFVPGIILFSGLVLATPALVIEDIRGATNAMQRSWTLTRGFRGRVLLAFVLGGLLLMVPSMALSFVGQMMGPEGVQSTAANVTNDLITALLQILIYPFLYVVTTVLYYDLRVRKEGFDLEMLASSLQPA